MIEIPFKTPGGNQIKKMPRYKYRELRGKIRRLLIDYIYREYVEKQVPRPFFEQAVLSLTYVAPGIERDYDNLVFSFKPWLDELQELSILAGDDQKRIGRPEYRSERGKECRVIIQIKTPGE